MKRDAYRKDEDKLSAKYNVVTKITGRSLTFKCKNVSELKSLVKKLIGILVFVTLTAGFFLLNHETFADSEVVDIVTLTIPSSCTLTSSAGDGATYTMNLTPGQYKNDIGPSTLSVFCNNNEGFSIYAVGFSNNEHGNNKMLTSTQDRYIATGTNTSGTPSSWAMKLTAVTASGDNAYTPTIVSPFNNFSNVPTSHAKVATVTSVSNGNAEASVQATYAVYVANAQVADTYTGKVKYTVVHPASNVPNEPKACSANKICYWPNAGNEVNDKMGDQSANYADNTNTITSNMDINLWPSHYKRTGYGFAGWSDAYDYVANVGSASNPNAHIYGPIENIHLDDMSSGLSLYAVWVPSAGYLQGWTGCTALQQGNVTALTDARDNDTYAVAKLADGNCWMIENLRLDYNANFDESLSQGFGKSTYYGSFIGLAAPETNLSNSTTANSLYKSDNSGDIKGVNGATLSDIGTGGIPGHRFPRYRNTNTSAASSNMTGPNQNIYSYGNYYNWPAALANVIWYSGPNATVDGYTSETVGTSLCPASWKLPRSGDKTKMESGTNDFYTLALDIIGTAPANYSSSNTPYWANGTEGTNASKEIRSYPNNFIYSGQAYSSSIANRGEAGYYWSSTVSNFSSYYTHYFSFSSMNVYPVSGADRYYGATIRCVLSN